MTIRHFAFRHTRPSRSSLLAPRHFLCWLAVPVLAFVAAATQAADPKLPNIVLIVAAGMCYGELGCYGQKIIKTPNIDELAKNGVRFTDFHCGAPVCAPSRCVLLTGKLLGHAAI